jgi:ferric-dicitrate binding protein FerR (iron transport regulator)
VEDFIADELFQQYVKAPDPGSVKQWEEWFVANPEQKKIADQAAAFIINLHFNQSIPSTITVQQSLEKNLRHIAGLENSARASKKKVLLFAAASLFVICVAFFTYSLFSGSDPVIVEVVTGAREVKTFILPDSSSVTINENSSIRYSSALLKAQKRELWMKGEVFFNIRHIEDAANSPHEFVVYSGDLKVEVLGTAFNVKSYNSVTNVSLNTGHIKVGVKNDPVSVTLQPGDFIQYSEKEKKIVKRKVDAGLYSTWKEKKLKLDKVPMKEIAQLIQDIYGYNVKIDEPALRTSKISGTLLVNDEETFLETLAFVLDIDIQKQDSILTFSSKSKLKKE